MPIFQINMLKPYLERQTTEERYEAIQCLHIICSIEYSVYDEDIQEMVYPTSVQKESIEDVTISQDWMLEQQLKVKEFLNIFTDIFTDVPG